MESPKTSINKYNRGFTVPEVMVAIGLLAVIGVLGLFVNMESLRSGSFSNDRDAAVSALRRARSLAVNNVCFGSACTDGKSHGVHFDPENKQVVIFQGGSYNSSDLTNEVIPFDDKSVYVDASSSLDVIFDRISGNAATTTIILKDGAGHISTIKTNSEGRIDW